MKHVAEQIVASKFDLLTLPAVYLRVKQVVDDPASTAGELAEVVASDPAMTGRLLRLVNSAIWGVRARVDSVHRAVTVLGLAQVHDLVLATAVAAVFARIDPRGMDVERYWRGSVSRALGAAAFGRMSGFDDPGRAFTEGLLSDLGHMVLYQALPEPTMQARAATAAEPWKLAAAEQALLQTDYAEVGAELVDRWRLSSPFGAAIRAQCAPQNAIQHGMDAALLHLAGILADALDDGGSPEQRAAVAVPEVWTITGLGADSLPVAAAEVRTHLAATVEAFGLNAGR